MGDAQENKELCLFDFISHVAIKVCGKNPFAQGEKYVPGAAEKAPAEKGDQAAEGGSDTTGAKPAAQQTRTASATSWARC